MGTPAAGNGRLYTISSGIKAYSLDRGQLLWSRDLHSYEPRALVSHGDILFVAEAIVSAVDGRTGRELWEFIPDANSSLGRAVADQDFLYFGTSGHRVYALRADSGQRAWVTDVGPQWKFPSVVRGVSVSGNTLFAAGEQWRTWNGATSSGWLVALDAVTGKILWRFATGSGEQRRGASSSPAVTPHLILISDYLSNAVVAVDRETGVQKWRFEGQRGFVGFPEAPVVQNDIAYAASGDGNVYALEIATGAVKWRAHLPGAAEAYAICGNNVVVNYQTLAVLDKSSGRLLQTILDDEVDFPTSGFATAGNAIFMLGPRAIYAFLCTP